MDHEQRMAINAVAKERDKLLVDLDAAGKTLGLVCCICTLDPGEELAVAPTHAAPRAVYDLKHQRDVAIARAEKAEADRDASRRRCLDLVGQLMEIAGSGWMAADDSDAPWINELIMQVHGAAAGTTAGTSPADAPDGGGR